MGVRYPGAVVQKRVQQEARQEPLCGPSLPHGFSAEGALLRRGLSSRARVPVPNTVLTPKCSVSRYLDQRKEKQRDSSRSQRGPTQPPRDLV